MNLSLAAIQPSPPGINFGILLPELILIAAGVVVMLVDAFTRRRGQRWITGGLSLAGLVAAAAATVLLWGDAGSAAPPTEPPWGGMIVLDPLRLSFTLVFIAVS